MQTPRGLAFQSKLGWMALATRAGEIVCLQFGHATAEAARRAVKASLAEAGGLPLRAEILWGPADRIERKWVRELQNYAAGKPARLSALPVVQSGETPFQAMVRASCRKLKRGEVVTYGELARRVGHPGAARAVGSVMRRNLTPLLVPCHRVLGANGLGGYSAPQGLAMKLHLLELEGAVEHLDCDCGAC